MKVRDVMTQGVVSVAPEAPIEDAISCMIARHVSGLPVIDGDGHLVGMVTEGDFLRRAETHTEAPRRRWLELLLGPSSPAEDYARSHARSVRDVMSPRVVTVGPDTPLNEVVRLMEEHAIKRLPVTDDGRVIGIVSRADLMSALAEVLSKPGKTPADDESIRRKILGEMRKQAWCPFDTLTVAVRDGVVELGGEIFEEGQRRALRVLVENLGGVKRVRDRLRLIEPLGGADAPKR